MKLNLADYVLSQSTKTQQGKVALVLVDDVGRHQEISYKSLYNDVCCLAAGLQSLGLAKSAVICIQAADVYDFILLFLASNAAGFVPAPLILSLSNEETHSILQDSNAALFFSLTDTPLALPDGLSCRVLSFAEYKTLRGFPFKALQTKTHANDPAFLFYTSGSSGAAKGVLHAQHAILGRKPSLKHWLNIQSNDIVLQTDNLCWTYSMFTGLLDPLCVGATTLVIRASNQAALAEDKISAEKWLAILAYYRVSVLISTPNIFYTLVSSDQFKQFKPSALRQAGAAGASLADEVEQQWRAQLHFSIFIALGMSEISTFISMGPKVPYRKDRLGKIQPGRKVSILPLGEGLEPVGPNTQGMLAIHQDEPGLMIGYVGSYQTERSKYRGEWFLTQDIVSMDSEGYIQYHGRADLLLKIDGGFRVSPIEIEDVLKSHSAVLDAGCDVFFDSKTSANQLIAYIVARDVNQQISDAIYQFLGEHLSDYKIPHYLCYVERLPLTPRNKLNRKELKQLIPLQKYQY
jgi:acetyl-CoA synthetase